MARKFMILLLVCIGMAFFLRHAGAVEIHDREIVSSSEEGSCLRAIFPTPVYSIKEIPSLYYDYDTFTPRIKVDEKGHMRELEFIALAGTKFTHKATFKFGRVHVYEVSTKEYESGKPLYIDANFVVKCTGDQLERETSMPPARDIINSMKGMVGKPYRWGGNYSRGIAEQENFYPYGELADLEGFLKENRSAWILEGVDCSGLLYEAANGCTPRNTSDLVGYGAAVNIEELSVDEIITKLKPLDLIVWDGHVVIVFSRDSVIESRPRYPDGHKGGVRIQPLKKRLEEIMATRKPVDNYYPDITGDKRFVIRRFID